MNNSIEPIYFSKVQYSINWNHVNKKHRLILDIDNKEISYQEFVKRRNMPAETGIKHIVDGDYDYIKKVANPLIKVRNYKTNFESVILHDNEYEEDVTFSYGIRLKEDDMEAVLPYCNALEFEPYRDREESEYYFGYSDNKGGLLFEAISNSYLPKIDFALGYYCDEDRIIPCEKLYEYLVTTYFRRDNKKLRGREITFEY